MKLGFIGLGKMGAQMVERLHNDGHEVVVFDVNPSAVTAASQTGGIASASLSDLVSQLPSPAVIWVMIPHQFVASTLADLLGVLPLESIVIDGGNSDYRETVKHSREASQRGITLMDVGTSGGILGRENGFSMMVGGDKASYAHIEPIVKSLCQPEGYAYFGPSGSGHYVKMVHNAIEYGLMEAYAEGYNLLKNGPYESIDLGLAASVWQRGSIIASQLNALNVEILTHDAEMSGVSGYVADSGEAVWSLESARAHNVPVPVIEASLEVRRASQSGTVNFATKLLAQMRNRFGGHALNK